MSMSTPYHDPTVPAVIIERYKLAYLMQFFVQHKQRFKFPRVRLQDLYRLLETTDTRPLSYLIVQILRFLKVPNATIFTVDKALDIFTNEKRTSTRICIHQVRANRLINELNAENKSKLLENLIETVYDELPDFNFAPNGFNGGNISNNANNHSFSGDNKSLNEIKQEENSDDSMSEMAIKAGYDSRGSSYVYLDDLRLYREKPQSSLSTQWDVMVGPTIDQWHSFIKSLGNTDEEGELKMFLQDHLLEVVCTSLESGELIQENHELNTSYLLNREQAELNRSSDYYSVNTNKLSNCSTNLHDINDSGGGGSISGDMNSLDPSGTTISIKQEMPDTPESYPGSSYITSNMLSQNIQMVPRSNSYPGSQILMSSPIFGSVVSPVQSSHGAPSTPSGDNSQMKTSPRVVNCQSREQRIDYPNIQISYTQPHQNLYNPPLHPNTSQHIPETMVGGQMRYQVPQRFPGVFNGHLMMIGNSPNGSQSGSQVMVFTTQMANDAALEHSRHRTPIYQFHNSHPVVTEFIQQCNPNRLVGLQKPENLTQKQLENRKNKMAKLEQIQSSLSKTKAQASVNPSNITQSISVSSILCDMQSRPLSSNQLSTSAGSNTANLLLSSGSLDSNSSIDNSMQDLSVQTSVVMPADNSGLSAQCNPFSNDIQMSNQYHFNGNTQMTQAEQQILLASDSNNPPTSEAALIQWEQLRIEYMREKQSHDVMNNMFPSVDLVPYTNSNGINPTMMTGNMPAVSAMMPGHRSNIIRQSFPPHSVPVEPSAGVIYHAASGVKRPYQLIGAPPPPGYHSHPLYNHHHESMVNQRALMIQHQQQQQPRCPPIYEPSWNMIHPSYPHISHHHPMHHNYSNMYPHHRGPTPPAVLGITNGSMSGSQNVSSNSSTTTTSTSSKSKPKKRKAAAKSTSSVTNSSTSTITSASLSNSTLLHTCLDVKQLSSSMSSDVQKQRYVNHMMTGFGLQDDLPQMNRNMVNFQDHVSNGSLNTRCLPLDTKILSNSSQIKHEFMPPNQSSFTPLGDIKNPGSINSSIHLNSSPMNNNNFSSNPITTYGSSSPSQNLTSASLASLARLSSQMSGGSDSPLFNSLQCHPTTHSSSISNNPISVKINNNNTLHSMSNQQIPDQEITPHQMSQSSNAGHVQSYPSYRHPSISVLSQLPSQHQQQLHQNNLIQPHEIQNRQQKFNHAAMLNLQSTPESNNFIPNHNTQSQMSQQQQPFQGSQEMMFSPYQSYSNQQMTVTNNNPANNATNNSTNNNSGIMPGIAIQPGIQQPPSIMVNNTFVNAQLNVQQMNYQHLAAPNVNAQMQIQQQHQAIQPSTILNQETASKHLSEISTMNTPISNNQVTNNPSNDTNNCGSNISINTNSGNTHTLANMGFMNSSVVQIQSKTPHTIQYLPADPVLTATANIPVNNNSHQVDMSGGLNKYANITAPSLELSEILSSQNKQMVFQPQNNELSTGIMDNIPSNNMTMTMTQQQIQSQQFRSQQHQQQIRLRPVPPGAILPQGTMVMRQNQSQQQQQHLVLQQSFTASNGAMLDQQMKQQQMQRLMMVNNNQIFQQQQQHMIMSGQMPGHPHYMSMDTGNQEQHLYHHQQQQFIAIQQQQIRQQSQGHLFG